MAKKGSFSWQPFLAQSSCKETQMKGPKTAKAKVRRQLKSPDKVKHPTHSLRPAMKEDFLADAAVVEVASPLVAAAMRADCLTETGSGLASLTRDAETAAMAAADLLETLFLLFWVGGLLGAGVLGGLALDFLEGLLPLERLLDLFELWGRLFLTSLALMVKTVPFSYLKEMNR